MATGENIGMMEGAFFVGRKTILDWLNRMLKTNFTKIEQTYTGAVACQLCDALYGPESRKVPMHKLKWDCKSDFEYTQNYKILQDVFQKVGVNKVIPVAQLIRGKYQDNLEFMQWFKRFFEINSQLDPDDYDAVGRRAKGKGAATFERMTNNSAKPKTRPVKPRVSAPSSRRTKPSSGRKVSAGGAASESGARKGTEKENRRNNPSSTRRGQASSAGAAQMKAANEKIQTLTGEIKSLNVTTAGLEKERDFYFGKLRDVEILLQNLTENEDKEINSETKAVCDSIFKILYATEDEFSQASTPAKEEASPSPPKQSAAIESKYDASPAAAGKLASPANVAAPVTSSPSPMKVPTEKNEDKLGLPEDAETY
eukprot:g4542.t1